MEFYDITIANIEHLVEDTATLTLQLPDNLYQAFAYYPGQHLIFKFDIDGQEYRRSYSLNSCPYTNEPLQVTVKRVKEGVISNYINDRLSIGDTVKVSVPTGNFYAKTNPQDYKSYYLFAAGSGITPILSILKSVLAASPLSQVYMLYGNKHQDSILFQKELEELTKKHSDRLTVVHTLSDAKVWTTWKQWNGKKGRIDANLVEEFITKNPPTAQHTEYYICGPGAMNASVKETLLSLDIPTELIHIEQFGAPKNTQKVEGVDLAHLTVSVKGQKHQIEVTKGQTILQVLKQHNLNAPYSCESGVCGTCQAKLTNGTVKMQANMALEDKDLKNGYILTCQAVPTAEHVEVSL